MAPDFNPKINVKITVQPTYNTLESAFCVISLKTMLYLNKIPKAEMEDYDETHL